MKNILLLQLAFFLSSLTGDVIYAQQIKGITSLHTFLQKNADSTLILKHESNWIEPPEYSIISKKGDTISLYSYKMFYYKNKIKMPHSIRDTLYKINNYTLDYTESLKVGVNKFLTPKYIDDISGAKFWRSLLEQKPWQIKDDKIDGEGCPKTNGNNEGGVYDGGGTSLYLITKKEIKRVYFYAPKYYEEKCPGRLGRKTILKIENLFSTYFK